ncbi:MAG: hypothetical protein NZT61_06750 [Deltaproteobacteria bacterium]|nr:hypothetical protein [Deltaproteobacteria bacterium]
MKRFAQVVDEAVFRLQELNSARELAELILFLRQYPDLFFNSAEEIRFLESCLVSDRGFSLAQKFLRRRFFTSSQALPLLLRELSVFNSLFYVSFSVNLHQVGMEKNVLNVCLSLRSTNGSEISCDTKSVSLSNQKFFDFVPLGYFLPDFKDRYWVQLDYTLVNLELEKVLYADSFSILPFKSQGRTVPVEFNTLTFYDPWSTSYIRILGRENAKSKNQKSTENGSNVVGLPLKIELNFVNFKGRSIYVQKSGELSSIFPREPEKNEKIIPEWQYDAYYVNLDPFHQGFYVVTENGERIFDIGIR